MNANDDTGEPSAAREWFVQGQVQGVGFRAATRRRAREVGVRGLAENLSDGRVRVIGVGPVGALDQLGAWLRRGPPAARVDALDERAAGAATIEVELDAGGFDTR